MQAKCRHVRTLLLPHASLQHGACSLLQVYTFTTSIGIGTVIPARVGKRRLAERIEIFEELANLCCGSLHPLHTCGQTIRRGSVHLTLLQGALQQRYVSYSKSAHCIPLHTSAHCCCY
jgi:hypothetical protein